MARIGVLICHCGNNIASVVEVERLAEEALSLPGVVYATTHQHLCSAGGQELLRQAIAAHRLDRLVIAACTPRLHETTFRRLLAQSGLNPYLLEIVNIREQCSWVHTERESASAKALDLLRMGIAKARKNRPLTAATLPIHKKCLVVGGGIAGIQTALDVAEAGHQVTLVEREPALGGKMAMLDKTFPTLDCAACILAPKLAEASEHPRIQLLTSCEIAAVTGHIGNFQVTIRQHPRYVNHDICTGCGLCEQKCPVEVESRFEQGLARRKAIYKLYPQAVPPRPVIDRQHCRKFSEDKCGLCAHVCPLGCIDFGQQESLLSDSFGAIVLATGYELIDWPLHYPEYGGGTYADIISGLQFERLVNASGPSAGQLKRPSDGTAPQTVVIVNCVGSRDPAKGKIYCSRACCMYAAKHARQVLASAAGARVYVFYLDMRSAGKSYEEFYEETRAEGALYIRGRIAKIYRENGKLICQGEDTLLGQPLTLEADLVVLETAMQPSPGAAATAALLGVGADQDGWLSEAHPKLRPVESQIAGVYLAGAAQGPKDITDTVAQASAAAAKVLGLLAQDEICISPQIATVNAASCSGCGLCVNICPSQAIKLTELSEPHPQQPSARLVAQVRDGLCSGCGLCAGACRSGAIDLAGSSNRQLLEEVDALWQR